MVSTFAVLFGKYLFIFIIFLGLIYLYKQKKDIQKKILLFSAICLPIAFIIAKIASTLYFDPRPFVTHHFTPLISHAANNGFPSDHSLISFAIASIVFVFNKKLGLLLFVLGLLVGFSRVYAGIHSPIDIIGSLAISVIVSYSVYRALQKYEQ